MYAVLDIGGTNIRVALAAKNSDNSVQLMGVRKIPVQNKYEVDLEHIANAIHELTTGKKITGIGISIAGDINTEHGYVKAVDYFKDWEGKPLAKDLGQTFNCTVKINNDAATAGLGEAVYGAGRDKDFLFLIWGSGFGGTAIQQTDRGPIASAFDPGHQIIHQAGLLCVCGQRGCLQAYVGGKEIAKLYGAGADKLPKARWNTVLDDVAQGLMNLVAIRPTELIIFGGGVAINQQEQIQKLSGLLRNKLTVPVPTIQVTQFGDDTALYGALALLRGST